MIPDLFKLEREKCITGIPIPIFLFSISQIVWVWEEKTDLHHQLYSLLVYLFIFLCGPFGFQRLKFPVLAFIFKRK